MNHRNLLPAVLFLFLMILNVACSDDPTDPGPPVVETVPTEDVSGSVDLPAGYTGDPAALTVKNGVGSADCDGGGAFTLPCYEDHDQFAVLLGPNGDPLYLGWLSAADGALSGRSTAEVLTWLGLGAWMLPNDAADAVRNVLADPATDLGTLAAAVDAEVLLNPDGFTSPNTAITDALANTVGWMVTKAGAAKDLTVDPDSTMSGVDVSYRGGLNSITIANVFRRRAVAYVWRTAYDTATEENLPFNDEDPIAILEVPPAADSSVTPSTIEEALAGDVSYASLDVASLHTPHYEESMQTFYAVNVLGFGAEPPVTPGDYTAEELEHGQAIAMRGLIQDYFLPLVFQLAAASIPAEDMDDLLGDDTLSDALEDFTTLAAAELAGFEQAVTVDRDWWTALGILSEGVAANATVGAGAWDLIDAVLTGLRYAPADIDEIFTVVSDLFAYFDLPTAVAGHIDVTAVGAQLGACKEAETWELTVTSPGVSEPATVHIEPGASEIGYYEGQTLNLVIDTPPAGLPDDGDYLYEWSCPGTCGTLINPLDPTDSSNDFQTASAQVRYVAHRAVEGTEMIHCTLYVQVGSSDIEVADADAEVEVVNVEYEVTLPGLLSDSDSLSLCPNGSYTFHPSLAPTPSSDLELRYTWTCSGSAGVLEGPEGETNTWSSSESAATYMAGEGGTDTVDLSVSANVDDVYVPIASASLHVDVEEQVSYGAETLLECYINEDGSGAQYWIYAYFDKIPGVTRYHLEGTGFDDPVYYGDHISITGPPWLNGAWSIESETWVKCFLAGGSFAHHPPGSFTDCQQVAEGSMWRFEGAVWVVTPICE